MPTYDYECDACGETWELFQKITDDVIKKCPKCKKQKARRLFGTGAAIVFKGSGFYQTDYRSNSYKKGEKAASDSSDSKAKAESDSSGEKKSAAAKPDAKPAGKPSESSKKPKSDPKD